MKIGNPLDLFRTGATAAGPAAADAERSQAAAAPPQPARHDASAKVKFSGTMTALKGSAAADGAFDSVRVEQLKAAIADGSFRVDAAVVAGKVISSNLEALTRTTL